MSDFVVHFTKGGEDEKDYKTMMSIYWECVLKPGRAFGIGRSVCPDSASQEAVCFSEIPPGQWRRLEKRRETNYGIAFTKKLVQLKGGGPIWYVWKDTPHWHILQEMMNEASTDSDAGIWKLTPLIDSPGKYANGSYFFDWEREWRHVGSFCFDPADAAFLLIPENLHDAARCFFEDTEYENLGPAYLCPFVDPAWERDRILNTIKAGGQSHT